MESTGGGPPPLKMNDIGYCGGERVQTLSHRWTLNLLKYMISKVFAAIHYINLASGGKGQIRCVELDWFVSYKKKTTSFIEIKNESSLWMTFINILGKD